MFINFIKSIFFLIKKRPILSMCFSIICLFSLEKGYALIEDAINNKYANNDISDDINNDIEKLTNTSSPIGNTIVANANNISNGVENNSNTGSLNEKLNENIVTFADPDGQELILDKLNVKTAINGVLSLTEYEFLFINPKAKRVEGKFSFLLPPNATVSRFAKDVNGVLMEGEVVERLKANKVYDEILHQMRDPALLEQDHGNRFNARIFPIEANSSVRLILSYTQLIPMKNYTRTYLLPLRGFPRIKFFDYTAIISGFPEETMFNSNVNLNKFEGTSALKVKNPYQVLKLTEPNYMPSEDISFQWKPDSLREKKYMLKSGDFYIAGLLNNSSLIEKKQKLKNNWGIYIDSSASSSSAGEYRLEAIKEFIKKLPENDSIDVYSFDNKVLHIAKGKPSQISSSVVEKLKQNYFLGGTDLSNAIDSATTNSRKLSHNKVVFITDGVATLGKIENSDIKNKSKTFLEDVDVHAVVIGSQQDSAKLEQLTYQRGRIVNIPLTENFVKNVDLATKEIMLPKGESFNVEDSLSEWVFPNKFTDVQEGTEILVIGKNPSSAENSLRITKNITEKHSNNSATKMVSFSKDLQNIDMNTFAPLLEREGYHAYLDYLSQKLISETDPVVIQAINSEQVRLSTTHRIMIPKTTWLVLESEADYSRFNIDRRSLSAILTISQDGITRIDRNFNGNIQNITAGNDKNNTNTISQNQQVSAQNNIKNKTQKTSFFDKLFSQKAKKDSSMLASSHEAKESEAVSGTKLAPEKPSRVAQNVANSNAINDSVEGEPASSESADQKSVAENAPKQLEKKVSNPMVVGKNEIAKDSGIGALGSDSLGGAGISQEGLGASSINSNGKRSNSITSSSVAPPPQVASPQVLPQAPSPQAEGNLERQRLSDSSNQIAENDREERRDDSRNNTGRIMAGSPSSGGSFVPPLPNQNSYPKKRPLPSWVSIVVPQENEIKSLIQAINLDARNRELYNQLTAKLFALKKWDELRDIALTWQKYDPENPQVYEMLGESFIKLGQLHLATRAFASLADFSASKPELLQRTGLLLMRLKEFSMAESPLQQALNLRPDRANTYRHLALLLWQKKDFLNATLVLEKALALNYPGWYRDVHRVIKEELAYIYRDWQRFDPSRAKDISQKVYQYGLNMNNVDAIRITLVWETDANDVDLHVTDPSGEEAYYAHKTTQTGLELYEDVTQGFGPEVIRNTKDVSGVYHVGVKYFSAGPMGVSRGFVTVLKQDDSKKPPIVEVLPFRLVNGGLDMRHVATIEISGNGQDIPSITK